MSLGAGPLAAAGAWHHRGAPAAAARTAARLLTVGWMAAMLLAGGALGGNPQSLPGFEATAVASLVLVLVLGMGATVLGFAARSLRHEPYQQRFVGAGIAIVSLGTTLATTTDLVVLAAAWCATSLATLQLVRTGPGEGTAIRLLRIRRALVSSDVLVVVAVTVLIVASGSSAMSDLGRAGAAAPVAGLLLVLAAALRSATAPFHRWLPDTLAAPTPASALLHAGVVNGGVIVLIKLAPAATGQWAPALLALALGGASCVFAEAVMLTRPDVKGRLAWSTVAQMSFTLALCGLGLYRAATLHLVAHGFYKGALFLGSGSNVRALIRSRTAPPVKSVPARAFAAVAFGLTGLSAVAAVNLSGAEMGADLLVPIALAWVTAGLATTAWLDRAGPVMTRLLGLTSGAIMLAAFTTMTAALKHGIGSSLPPAETVHPGWIVPILAALALVAVTHRAPATLGASERAWAWIRAAGRPVAPRPLHVAWPEGRAGRGWWSERRTPALSPALDDGLIGG